LFTLFKKSKKCTYVFILVKGGNALCDIPLINIKHARNKLAGILILSSFKKNKIMKEIKLDDISAKMRKLDICMMTTQSINGDLTSRPMSNNGDVEYDGNSYFFSLEESDVVKELKENNTVNLSFQGRHYVYISISGKAKLVKDKAALEEHWLDELEKWFEDGVNTPGIIMIHVKAESIKFWHKEEEGEIKL